ncbi:FAD-dependent oxidoreductase [Occultella aeris]|uniref:FAD-dependent oxidoreductase n=1 Tax=Occultella aeris TaxID=2761496 RepID=UPI001E530A78|nr:FAD-dependent oxidoreductase [Occultella aeris]
MVMTEEYAWLGGQLMSRAVPPDEHPWIEMFGATRGYRHLRDRIRGYYRANYPLTDPLRDVHTGAEHTVEASYVIDATKTGDLLPLTGTEYTVRAEPQSQTGEPSAPAVANPDIQALGYCFAVDHVDGDHTIDRPEAYEHWRSVRPEFWGAPLLSFSAPNPRTLEPLARLFDPSPVDDVRAVDADRSKQDGDVNPWMFRRIVAHETFAPGYVASRRHTRELAECRLLRGAGNRRPGRRRGPSGRRRDRDRPRAAADPRRRASHDRPADRPESRRRRSGVAAEPRVLTHTSNRNEARRTP